METYTNNNKKPEITVIIPSYNVEGVYWRMSGKSEKADIYRF